MVFALAENGLIRPPAAANVRAYCTRGALPN